MASVGMTGGFRPLGTFKMRMDTSQAMSILGFPSSQAFEHTTLEEIETTFMLRVHALEVATAVNKGKDAKALLRGKRDKVRKLNEAYQYLIRKRKKLSGRAMFENWQLVGGKSNSAADVISMLKGVGPAGGGGGAGGLLQSLQAKAMAEGQDKELLEQKRLSEEQAAKEALRRQILAAKELAAELTSERRPSSLGLALGDPPVKSKYRASKNSSSRRKHHVGPNHSKLSRRTSNNSIRSRGSVSSGHSGHVENSAAPKLALEDGPRISSSLGPPPISIDSTHAAPNNSRANEEEALVLAQPALSVGQVQASRSRSTLRNRLSSDSSSKNPPPGSRDGSSGRGPPLAANQEDNPVPWKPRSGTSATSPVPIPKGLAVSRLVPSKSTSSTPPTHHGVKMAPRPADIQNALTKLHLSRKTMV